MTFSFTVAGVSKTIQADSMQITKSADGRDTLRAKLYSASGAYRPAIGAEVLVVQDGVNIFGGNIIIPRETGALNQPIAHIWTEIQAVSFKALPDRIYITETVASGTALETFIDALVTAGHFTAIGITKSGSQVTGPNLPSMSFDGVKLSEVFDQLAKATDWVWDIDSSKVFSMLQPSATAAPFNITTANVFDDVTVEQSRDKYANRVTVRAGNPGIQQVTDTFAGDGSTTTYTLGSQMVYIPVVGRGYVTVAGVNETLGLSGATWIYDPTANTITRSSAPANGAAVSITYDGQFPIFVTAEDTADQALNGLYTFVHNEPTVYDRGQALQIATNLLAVLKNTIKTVTYSTYSAGLKPGQTQTITLADRNLSGSFTIQEVAIFNDVGNNKLRHEVVAIGGTTPVVSVWRDQYRRWLGGGGGGSTTSAPAVSMGTTGAPGGNDRNVQFNNSGSFGGSDLFVWKNSATYNGFPANVSIKAEDESRYNLVLVGPDGSFLAAQTFNGGSTYFTSKSGTTADHIFQPSRNFEVSAAGEVIIDVGNNYSDQIHLRGIAAAHGLSTGALRSTSTSITLDSTAAPLMTLIADPTSAAITVNLPALANAAINPATGQYRIYAIKNGGSANSVTIDPNGSETIDGASTYVLTPGQSVIIQALTGTGAGWKILASHLP